MRQIFGALAFGAGRIVHDIGKQDTEMAYFSAELHPTRPVENDSITLGCR